MCLLVAGMMGGAAAAQEKPDAVFRVDFTNAGLVPAHWTMEFHPDGTGHFRSERGNAARSDQDPIEPPDVDRDIRLSATFASHVFQVAERKQLFAGGCESRLRVAFQGLKKLRYEGPAGKGGCEFNYSKDAEIQNLGDALVSVASTVIEGARLQALLQHDRLGLDKEMEILVEAAADGRARQICSIQEILEELTQDPTVLERVKRRARALLAKANN
jgi:hypothetical protein